MPHGRRLVQMRDLPWAGRPVTTLRLKRLWRCAEPACLVRKWLETTWAECRCAAWCGQAAAGAMQGGGWLIDG